MQDPAIIEKKELTIPSTLKTLIEALIFAAQEPLSIAQMRILYQGEGVRKNESRSLDPETIRQIVSDLNQEYEKNDRPYRIVQIAGGYQFATLSVYAEWLGKLRKEQGRRRLSQSGIETLAIIAYKQPITKAEVEKIRGVNCDYVLKALLEKELLTITGRAESVGRPLLYGTTREFLKHFGLNDITDLPRPREIEEILGESQFETERRMLEAQAGAERMKKDQEDFKSRLPHIPKKKPGLEEREVEIVPQIKTREIRIVPVGDRTLREEVEQEKIEFIDAPKDESLERQTSASIAEELRLIEGQEAGPGGISETSLPFIAGPQEQGRMAEMTKDVSESSSGIEKEIMKGVDISTNLERITIAETNRAKVGDQPKPKRWLVWKEKIQGFIKKLFV